jgi:CheY-like chemotaxis protein
MASSENNFRNPKNRMIVILYVDADPTMWKIISRIFENYCPVSVFPAGSGEEALGWLSQYHADVIVSEFDLPAMTGIELLHALRSEDIFIPFIFFSENDSAHVKNEAYQKDVFGFIQRKGLERKPIMNLLRLILWAAGNTETEYPFHCESEESDGDTGNAPHGTCENKKCLIVNHGQSPNPLQRRN